MKIFLNKENLKNHKTYLKIQRAVEEFLEKKGYLKIDLPVLSPALIPESYLEIFETEFKYFKNKEKLYLTPSPELFLKRLLAYGIGDCYYLGKSFRNEEPNSGLHSFEFNMLEIYKMKANYLDLADEVLEMLRFINKNNNLVYQGNKISLTKWEKITVAEAFKKYGGINSEELFDKNLFIKKAKEKKYRTENFSYEDLFSQIYVQEVEPHLGNNGYPTLIYDYPKEFAALAQLNHDGKTAQRFEFYIGGVELGDCYTELTDWKEQEERFLAETRKREKEGKIRHPVDKGFIDALKYGTSQTRFHLDGCSGIAIGFDRLAMIFADVDSIDELRLINIK